MDNEDPENDLEATQMDAFNHPHRTGDRIRAKRRSGFPLGTVLQLLANGYLLVHWDGQLIETVHCDDVEKQDGL